MASVGQPCYRVAGASPFWKWMLSLGTLLPVIFEGLRRIFHGNHYLTGVLAGYLLGIAWLVWVCIFMEGIFMRRGETNE